MIASRPSSKDPSDTPPEPCQPITSTCAAAYPQKWSTAFRQLSRYSVVSALALATDMLVYVELIHSGTRAVLAGIMSYMLGLVIHFVLSCRYVFDAMLTRKSQGRLFSEFVISGVMGVALTATLIWIETEIMHQGAMIAKLNAVAVSFLVVFILRRRVVFAGG